MDLYPIKNGDILFASIYGSSRTNNPTSIIRTALFARNVLEAGGKLHPNVITFFGPGSKVVSNYLHKTGLQQHLDLLGFHAQLCFSKILS